MIAVGEFTSWPPPAPSLTADEKKKAKAALWKFIQHPDEDELDQAMYEEYPPEFIKSGKKLRHEMEMAGERPTAGISGPDESQIKSLLENVLQYGEDKAPEDRLPTPSQMSITLLPHQQLGVEWMLNMEKGTNKGGILADDMGLGKTVQSIGVICANPPTSRERRPTLILCPVSLMEQVSLLSHH